MTLTGVLKAYWRTIVLAALGVAVLVNLVVSNRPIAFYSMLQVTEIETLPDTPELADVRRYTEIGSGFIPHMGLVWGRSDLRARPVKVGWVYKEVGFLGMPYYAENVSTGPSLYIDTGEGYQLAGVSPRQVPLLEEKVGRPFLQGYSFGWYWHVWGVLFPPLLLLLIWMWRRERHAREEARWHAEAVQA